MSDIHGEYGLFQKMLQVISFDNRDELYICGDIIDKGKESIALAKYISQHPNIHCIIGNHEDAFLKYYHHLMEIADPREFDSVLKKLQDYFPDKELIDWDLLDWMEMLPYYIESNDFICVHAGMPIQPDGILFPMEQVANEYLIYDRKFKEPHIMHFSPKCVFFGHTQTDCVCGQPRILTYLRPHTRKQDTIRDYYKIHLDTGAWINGVMGCFCMDTCKSYYVKSH